MITIKQGDVTDPIWKDTKQVIVQCVNDEDCMGAGVARAIFEKWPKVKEQYHAWSKRYKKPRLGDMQMIVVEPNIAVCNIVGQKGMRYFDFPNVNIRIPAVRYDALYEGFVRLRSKLTSLRENSHCDYTLHLPLIGSGLAGGDFYRVYTQYINAFINTDFDIDPNFSTCFYAWSDEDFESLKKVYEVNNKVLGIGE